MNGELQAHHRAFAHLDAEMKSIDDSRKKKQQKWNDSKLELKRLAHEVERFRRDQESARDMVSRMLKEHSWIEEQQEFALFSFDLLTVRNFGKANTAFDFGQQNPTECRQRLKQLEQQHDTLRKKINVKVMNMIDRCVLFKFSRVDSAGL